MVNILTSSQIPCEIREEVSGRVKPLSEVIGKGAVLADPVNRGAEYAVLSADLSFSVISPALLFPLRFPFSCPDFSSFRSMAFVGILWKIHVFLFCRMGIFSSLCSTLLLFHRLHTVHLDRLFTRLL